LEIKIKTKKRWCEQQQRVMRRQIERQSWKWIRDNGCNSMPTAPLLWPKSALMVLSITNCLCRCFKPSYNSDLFHLLLLKNNWQPLLPSKIYIRPLRDCLLCPNQVNRKKFQNFDFLDGCASDCAINTINFGKLFNDSIRLHIHCQGCVSVFLQRLPLSSRIKFYTFVKIGFGTAMRKVMVIILGLAVLTMAALAGYQRWDIISEPDKSQTDLQTARVERGTIVATVFAVGNVAASRQANLAFTSFGVIDAVNVEVGDAVEQDQVLAWLDTSELEWNVANAELNVAIREAELAKLKAGATESEQAAAQATLDAAQRTLVALKEGASSAEIDAARSTLDAAQASYELVISPPISKTIRQAELQLEYAKNTLWQAQSQRDAACGAERTSKSMCDAFEAAVGNAHVQIEQATLALEQVNSSPLQAELRNALAQVKLAQANLDKLLTGANAADIAAAEAQIVQAQAQLDKLTRGPSPEDLQIIEARVKQARLALQQARQNLADATLTAPFAGMAVAVNYRVGDTVRPELPGITLADLSQLEIKVNVAEVDISQVQLGQEAEILLDALPDQVISGRVTMIAPMARSEMGVVNYPVTISISDNASAAKPGMTGNVSIIVGRRENVLFAPNRSIRQVRGRYVVTVLQGDQLIETPVRIGLSNDSMTEIVNGLEEGEEIVLNVTSIQSGLDSGFFQSSDN
jgi:HlyD family secretion protein